MSPRALSLLLSGGLLMAATGVFAAEPPANGAATPPAPERSTLQRAKARKAAAAEQPRGDRAPQKSVTERTTVPSVTPTTTRPASPATESFHDCHSQSSDA